MLFSNWDLLPDWFTTFFTLVFGLIIGSFLNVVIARVPRGQSIVRPRSRCTTCGLQLAARDTIPVLSWLLLRGKCRGCTAPISVRYPLIELLTALLFLGAKIRFGFGPLLLARDFPFIALMVAVTFVDLEHRIIPDRFSLGGLVFGLATAWFAPIGFFGALQGAALGFGVFYGFAWIYLALTGRSGLGGGDIKLLAMLGAFVGPAGVMATVLCSSILGSVIGITWAVASKQRTLMKAAIPYGPFLAAGALYYYLLGEILPWPLFMKPT